MKLWIKLAFKEIKNNYRFSLFFILNMAIGLAGFIALNSFNSSLNLYFENNLRDAFTADMMISSARPLTSGEEKIIRKNIGNNFNLSKQIGLFSMVSSGDRAKLSQIVAIDSKFPLYGNFSLTERGKTNPQIFQIALAEHTGIWVSKDALIAFDLKKGSKVKIGNKEFYVDDVVNDDPSDSISSFNIAPKIYLAVNQLKETGLIQFGSRISYHNFYSFPKNTDLEKISASLIVEFDKLHPENRPVRVQTSGDALNQLKRIIGVFTGYLGLIGIIALFLAGIGCAYLFMNYLGQKRKEMAILISLGASRNQTVLMIMLQLGILGIISALVANLVSFLILPAFPLLLGDFLPAGFSSTPDLSSLFIALALGSVGSLIFCLPIIIRIYSLKPNGLLQESFYPLRKTKKERLAQLLSIFPELIAFWGMSIWQTESWYEGSIFFVSFLISMILIGAFGWVIFIICGRLSKTSNILWNISLRNLYRNRAGSITCFVAIGTGAFLINLLPQLQQGIQTEIGRPDNLKVPGLFLFDIQPEQLDPLKGFLKERELKLNSLSPMVRGRINTVNGKNFNQRKRNENRIRKGRQRHEFNFSYRKQLSKTEVITAGREFSQQPYDFEQEEPAEVSLAESFAERYNLKIGDVIEFDLLGIPIEGKVISLRKVRWNSFQPNFFILFQDGVLNDAPQTHLASVRQLEVKEKLKLQKELVNRFPNISVLDVSRTVEKILAITDRIALAVNFMAYLCIFAGLVVVYSIARHEVQGRIQEINLLKVLGAGFGKVRRIVLLEFGILGFTATLFGILLSLILSFGFSQLFFENLWQLSSKANLFSLLTITGISLLTAFLAANKAIRQKPVGILRGR